MYKLFSTFILSVILFHYSLYAQNLSNAEKSGAYTFEEVKKTYGIYINPPLLSEVEKVGRKLEKHLNFSKPIKYFLLDTPEPNAFATAGGYVYVTRGLLCVINSRDELAGIMAHEISHVTHNHPRKIAEFKLIPALLEVPANLLGLVVNKGLGELINLPIEAAAVLPTAAFSRYEEKEADLYGIQLAIKAGFEPYGLVTGLERLTSYIEYFTKEHMTRSLFIDHPATPDRVKYLTNYLKKKGYKRPNAEVGSDMAVLNGLLYGSNPKYGVLNENLFLNPIFKFKASLPQDWTHHIDHNTVTSLGKDKKSIIVFKVDSSSKSLLELSNTSKLKDNYGDQVTVNYSEINGLKAHHNTLVLKSGNLIYQELWIQLSEGHTYIKIEGVGYNDIDNVLIRDFITSVKSTQDYDLDKNYYPEIKLLNLVPEHKLDYFYPNSSNREEFEVLAILNNTNPEAILNSKKKFVKVFNFMPLSNLK